MARRKRAHEEEEHENHERWLVTYADMVTLLMVLFIVMFAMSTVDQKKFHALRAGLAAGFGQSTTVLDGTATSVLDAAGTAPMPAVNPNRIEETPELEEIKSTAVTQALAEQQQRAYAEASGEAKRLLGIEKRLMAALERRGLTDDVMTTIDGRGLTVSLVSRHIVFEANLATLTQRGRTIVDTLAPVLADLDDKLAIEGHTNQAPGRPLYYASDWDLSTARAITVLRRFNELRGIPESRLSAVGFGQVKPRVDPAVPGSQKVNKRVDIVVLSRLADESGELLDRVMYDRRKAAQEKRTQQRTPQEPAPEDTQERPATRAGTPTSTQTTTEEDDR